MRRFLIAAAATAAFVSFANAQTITHTVKEEFVTSKPTDVLSYNLIGLKVTNNKDEKIGEIRDLIISEGQLSGYIVSVGGFLGMGDKYVIVNPKALHVTYSDTARKWAAKMEVSKEGLQKAHEFKYEGRWAR